MHKAFSSSFSRRARSKFPQPELLSSDLLKRCYVFTRHRCVSPLEMRSPLFGEERFDDSESFGGSPPKSSSLLMCASSSSSYDLYSSSLSLTTFSSPMMSRILAPDSNVIYEDFTSLVSCINHTYLHSDERSCPITSLCFA